MYTSLFVPLLLPTLASAHFLLNYPQPLGYPDFDEDTEGDSPCGGRTIAFANNDTALTVSGFQLATRTTHPQANWLLRATLDTAEPFNWTDITDVISQSGLGNFCATNLSLPAEFVGKQGLIQVTQQAVDGNLYQCAAVNFVEGSSNSWPEQCVNGSGVTATLTTDTTLSNDTSSTTGTATSSGSSSTASSSSAAIARMEVAGGLSLLALLPVGMFLL